MLLNLYSSAVLDKSSLMISPSSEQTFTLGLDNDLISLNCSVRGNPLPLLQWSRYNSSNTGPLDAIQAATGFNETASSILTLNITELGAGIHSFQCTATVHTLMTLSESSSTVSTITVQPLLQNISIDPEIQTFVTDSSTNVSIELNCSVFASPAPRIQWFVNGVELQERPIESAGDTVFFSNLELSLGELEFGENNVTCYAFQDAASPPITIVDTATVTVNSMLLACKVQVYN